MANEHETRLLRPWVKEIPKEAPKVTPVKEKTRKNGDTLHDACTVKLKNDPLLRWLIRKRSRACHQPSGWILAGLAVLNRSVLSPLHKEKGCGRAGKEMEKQALEFYRANHLFLHLYTL